MSHRKTAFSLLLGLLLGLGTSLWARISVDPHPTNPNRVLFTWSIRLPVTPGSGRLDSPLDMDEQGIRDAIALRLGLTFTCNQARVDAGDCAAGQLGKTKKVKILCTSDRIVAGDCLLGEEGTLVNDPRSKNRVIGDELDRFFERLTRQGREMYVTDMADPVDTSDIEHENNGG